MSAVTKHYFGKLASLRFFAALLVLLSHLKLDTLSHDYFVWFLSEYVFWCGFIGVSIFYVLSGFVISYANDRWHGWGKYLIGRVARIYPAHIIVTIIIVMLFGISLHVWKNGLVWLLNLSLLQAWIPSQTYYYSLNDVSWSLSVEMFFYVMFIFLRRLSNRHIYALCLGGYFLDLALQVVFQYSPQQWTQAVFYINPMARLPEFLMGMSIYRLYKSRKPKLTALTSLDFSLLFVLMVATVAMLRIIQTNIAFLYSTVPALFAFLIVSSLVMGRSSSYMKHPGLVLLGEASFALYLIHRAVLRLGLSLINRMHPGDPILISILFALLAIGLSVAFYLVVEMRATRSVRGVLTRVFT